MIDAPLAEVLMRPETLDRARAWVAAFGCAVLVARLALRARCAVSARLGRALDVALLAAALLSACAYWNFFRFHSPRFGHASDTYHYYLGSKYQPELGYTRLYRCTALADAENTGQAETRGLIRSLETHALEARGLALSDPAACKSRFSASRWAAFRHDVAWFRTQTSAKRWRRVLTDHGYNATPVLGWIAGSLANTGPASDAQVLALRLLDPLALLAAWSLVGWAFGWRVLCGALVYWGTNYPNQYGWVGGSLLRQLDIAALLASIALLARGRAALAGALFALAATTRLYPALLVAGPLLQWGLQALRRGTLAPGREWLRFGVASALCAAALVTGAAIAAGPTTLSGFVDNTRLLRSTPLRNQIGLPSLLAFAPDEPQRALDSRRGGDPYADWKSSRRAHYAQRRGLHAALLLGALVLLARAVAHEPPWVALALSAGLVPFALDLTSYYATGLAVLALPALRHPPLALALALLSLGGWLLVGALHVYERIFAGIGALSLVCVAYCWWRVAHGPAVEPAPATTEAGPLRASCPGS